MTEPLHSHSYDDGGSITHGHPEGDKPHTHAFGPRQRPEGNASLATAVITGVLGALALLGTLVSGNDADSCYSSLGQIAQGFSQSTAQNCSTLNTVHTLALFATVVLGVSCIVATLTHLLRK